VNQGYLEDTKSYQGGDAPPEHLALHFVPFSQGMLYVGSAGPLEQSQLELVQSLAEAFSVAYARYEDFIKLESAHAELGKTLEHLKSTQAQLIQSEKMASLGELTAGIAHEIQNPLNFVNNFSELNEELIAELKDELKKGNVQEAANLAEDLFQNEEKIKQHGKRAEGIVKSMLQHSRINSGQKELTDINALCDEYLRLAYHGMRAKDKSFNATYKLDLDPDLPKVNVVPQDIGRVLLNLINNAFHACAERSRSTATNNLTDLAGPGAGANLSDFKPLVSVTTKLSPLRGTKGVEAVGLLITISDNGPGIPEKIKDKIFQPFFTTKPAGQGTGLGLSLSYDIIKAHGGNILMESDPNIGTTFLITLPTHSSNQSI
jgi:signal transduction histidine kinase